MQQHIRKHTDPVFQMLGTKRVRGRSTHNIEIIEKKQLSPTVTTDPSNCYWVLIMQYYAVVMSDLCPSPVQRTLGFVQFCQHNGLQNGHSRWPYGYTADGHMAICQLSMVTIVDHNMSGSK